MRYSLLCLVYLIAACSLNAQTKFRWPEGAIDYSRYESVEECLAAMYRLRDSVKGADPVLMDTLPPSEGNRRIVDLPSIAVDAGRQCSKKFDARATPLKDWFPTHLVYLMTRRDNDARVLLSRRTHQPSDTSAYNQASILDSAAMTYLRATPVRWDMLDTLFDQVSQFPLSAFPALKRISLACRTFTLSLGARDSAYTMRAARRVVAMTETLTETDRQAENWNYCVYNALDHLQLRELLDSLRFGKQTGYIALKRANWERAVGKGGSAIRLPIGDTAPSLVGHFWYEEVGKPLGVAPVRPSRGKVSLVVFVSKSCYRSIYCASIFAALRRLHTQFPWVEIDLVTNTAQHLDGTLFSSPTEEADFLSRWYLGYHKLPATLIVETSRFWRVPDPDRRMVPLPRENAEAYKLGVPLPLADAAGVGYLVDRNGAILEILLGIDGRDEWRAQEILRVMDPQKER